MRICFAKTAINIILLEHCVGCHHEINKIIMIVSNQGYDAKNEQYIYYF